MQRQNYSFIIYHIYTEYQNDQLSVTVSYYYEYPVLGERANWQHSRRQKPHMSQANGMPQPNREILFAYAVTANATASKQFIEWGLRFGFGSGFGFNFDIPNIHMYVATVLVAHGFLVSLRNFSKICALHFGQHHKQERENIS